MKIHTFTIALLTAFMGLSTLSHAEVAPCEDMLKDLRAARLTAKLSDADIKITDDLQAKGIERCNADDDKRADGFFTDAMKIVTKK
jgi:hypothetical protein